MARGYFLSCFSPSPRPNYARRLAEKHEKGKLGGLEDWKAHPAHEGHSVRLAVLEISKPLNKRVASLSSLAERGARPRVRRGDARLVATSPGAGPSIVTLSTNFMVRWHIFVFTGFFLERYRS
jgi:hypothetical protein